MTTRHLSISLTAYSPDHWSCALLETTCPPGKPARAEALRLKTGSGEECFQMALDCLYDMRSSELARYEGGVTQQ